MKKGLKKGSRAAKKHMAGIRAQRGKHGKPIKKADDDIVLYNTSGAQGRALGDFAQADAKRRGIPMAQ